MNENNNNNQQIPIRKASIQVPDFIANQQIQKEQQKMSKYPNEQIPLPTNGWFYPEEHPLSTGIVEMKQMTTFHEDILSNQNYMRRGIVIDKLLEALIVSKFNLSEILVPDKNALIIAARRLAYGDSMPCSITCPGCSEENKVNVNLSTIVAKPFDFEKHPKGQNEFTFKLPTSGITITYKILTQLDETAVETEINEIKKKMPDVSREMTTRLKHLITSVDGNSDRAVIRKFVDGEMLAKDSLAFRNHMRENNPNLDMTFDFKCQGCQLERRLDVPFGITFLWPDFNSTR